MKSKQINENWHEKKITALENPISEFNARSGLDFSEYQAVVQHINEKHPDQGKEDWERIKASLPSYELAQDPTSLQSLRIQRFNWPTNQEELQEVPVTIINSPFSVPLDLPHIEYQNYLLAEAIGSPVLFIENPGYGESEKLTDAQKENLRSGDFHKVSDSMLGIIASLGTKKINTVGYSMGSELAAAIAAGAASYQLEVENVFIMESPRIEKQNPLKLAKNFAGDADNLKFAWQHPIDPVLRETSELKIGLPKGLFTYGMALFKGGIQSDIEAALQAQPKMRLTIANAGASTISSSKANADVYDELKQKYPKHSINRIVMPGESHAFKDNGPRFADLAGFVLKKIT